jgi:hypothetical protein
MEAKVTWRSTHLPTLEGAPFATVPLRATAHRVAALITAAWSKRISQYRWCPSCFRRTEPEHMRGAVCHGCAERVFQIVF